MHGLLHSALKRGRDTHSEHYVATSGEIGFPLWVSKEFLREDACSTSSHSKQCIYVILVCEKKVFKKNSSLRIKDARTALKCSSAKRKHSLRASRRREREKVFPPLRQFTLKCRIFIPIGSATCSVRPAQGVLELLYVALLWVGEDPHQLGLRRVGEDLHQLELVWTDVSTLSQFTVYNARFESHSLNIENGRRHKYNTY